MGFFELLLLALGLSMDACAVSVCKGLSLRRISGEHMLACGAYFGGFQALMPLLGYLMGIGFQTLIADVDHWIAFALLGMIGLNMIRSAANDEAAPEDISFSPRAMLPLAVATSIDALAVGVTFAFLKVRIVSALICIGTTTFALSAAGVMAGNLFGSAWKNRAEAAGGGILILIGLKILLEHLFF